MRSFTLSVFFFTLLLSTAGSAQECEYELFLSGQLLNSWEGSSVTITVEGDATAYALEDVFSQSFPISVSDGDSITIEFTAGLTPTQVFYSLTDSQGGIVFEDGIFGAPEQGLVFEGNAACLSCPPIAFGSVEIEDVRAFQASLSWVPTDPQGATLIELGPAGFVPGTGEFETAGGASFTLTNLAEKTEYELYLAARCSNGDTSSFVGPFSFETPFAVDLGVSEILAPATGCDIGPADSITLIIQNFGGTPQTLVPFNFSVNQQTGGVSMPTDGVYTGVLGTDSTDIATFDAIFDTSEPGEYLFRIWTDAEDDSDRSNDTTELLVVNQPILSDFPYQEDFESNSGFWAPESAGDSPFSWEHGRPAGTAISTAVSGNNIWASNLQGDYNADEFSYLYLPCLDFSNVAQDPIISFFLNLDLEGCCDELFMELSTDGGDNWSRLGAFDTGFNWYNDANNAWWDGNAGVDGWRYVTQPLDTLAGMADVRIRFVLSSDFSVQNEGVGIDNLYLGSELAQDLAATNLPFAPLDEACGSSEQTVRMEIGNFGGSPVPAPQASYSVNGGPVVSESLSGTLLLPGDQTLYEFEQPFDASEPGTYVIKAWTNLPDDEYRGNDTLTYVYRVGYELPFLEDFEAGILPEDWAFSGNVSVGNTHNNESFVLFSNLYEGNPQISVETPLFGRVEAGDTLRFDYRYVSFPNGESPVFLINSDSLILELSTDCGATYDPQLVITGANHQPSLELQTVAVPLDSFVGESLRARFRAVHGNGDYYLDIDNVNVRRCPASLGLTAEVMDASGEQATDGVASIRPSQGRAPYTYTWSNGASGATLDSLAAGAYEVTVSDAFGCEDVIELDISITSTSAVLDNIGRVSLFPNPTTDQSTLQVRLRQPMDARIQVFNAVGQLLFEQRESKVLKGDFQLNLRPYDGGLYLVRIVAGGQSRTVKLLKR